MTPLPLLPPPEIRKKLRTAMGVTIRAASAELGVSNVSYTFWERGTRTPNPEHLRAYHAQLSRWQEAVIDSVSR
jgi:transcriptional regulator with XRE-family HTH domain